MINKKDRKIYMREKITSESVTRKIFNDRILKDKQRKRQTRVTDKKKNTEKVGIKSYLPTRPELPCYLPPRPTLLSSSPS